jgi:hypothetical protein
LQEVTNSGNDDREMNTPGASFNIFRVFAFLLLFYLAAFAVWMIVLWPGVYTTDSLSSLSQLKTGELSDLHPFAYTLYIGFLAKTFHTPAAVLIAQIVATSVVASAAFAYFYGRASRHWLVLLCAVAFGLSPAVGLMNVVLWKDIPFSIAVLVWVLLCLCANESAGRSRSPYSLIIATLLLTFTTLVRHNGVVLIVLVPLALWWASVLTARNSLALGIGTGGLYLVITCLLAAYLNVESYDWVFRGQKLQSLGGLLVAPHTDLSVLTAAEKEAVNQVLPPTLLKQHYTCSDGAQWIEAVGSGPTLLKDDQINRLVLRALYRLAIANPLTLLKVRACYFWSVLSATGFIYANDRTSDDRETQEWIDSLGGVGQALDPRLDTWGQAIIDWSTESAWRLFVWNLWLPFIVAVYAFGRGIRGEARLLSASVLCLGQAFVMAVCALAPDWRYFYYVYLGCFFFIPALFGGCFEESEENTALRPPRAA